MDFFRSRQVCSINEKNIKENRTVPELPDVEVLKRYFDSTALHQKIEEVKASSKQVLKGVSSSGLEKEIKGRSFSYTDRYGKYLFAYLDGDKAILLLHFGMTGFLKYFKAFEKEPPHNRLLITFKNGSATSGTAGGL
jgi:formamidopyrimidine-DNA glycosylase